MVGLAGPRPGRPDRLQLFLLIPLRSMPRFAQALGSLSFVLAVVSQSPATTVGAYWAFQIDQDPGDSFTESVSVNTWPNGVPTFAYSGSRKTSFGNFGLSYTAHDGTTWVPGRSIGWNLNSQPSIGNEFEIAFDSTDIEELSVRLKYRLNGSQTGSGPVSGFQSFEYRVNDGDFTEVPDVTVTLSNNSSYNNEWVADLGALTEIEDRGEVTLRWVLPDLVSVAGTQIRIDDIEITGRSTVVQSNRSRYLPEQRYNVVFIVVDDLKPMIGAYGDSVIQTPNLDRLAASGMTFTNAHCQQAICNASRVSVMTGLRVDTTKTWDLSTFFRDTVPSVVTLPEHFKNNGYTTKGVGKVFHAINATKQDEVNSWSDGWTHHVAPHKYYGTAAAAEDSGDRNASSTDRGVLDRDGTTPVTDQHYNDGLNAEYAISKLAEYATAYEDGNGTPFFLALGFQKPHLPFNCPDEYWAIYDSYMSSYDLSGYTAGLDDRKNSVPSGSLGFTAPFSGEPSSYTDTPLPPSASDARRLIHGYLACVTYVDHLLGDVLDAIDDQGLRDSTVVVLWGDHGWHLNDHNGWWAKHSNYEQATRSPLIIRVPGMDALATEGASTNTPMELVDIYPTLIDLCGLPPDPQPEGFDLEGASFLPLLEDVNQPWKKAAFSQYQRSISGFGVTNSGQGMGYSLRTERYRYTEWWRTHTTDMENGIVIDRDEKLFASPEFIELYDYELDPSETINFAADPAYAGIVVELAALLDEGNGWSQSSVEPPFDYPETIADWQARHLIAGYGVEDLEVGANPDGDALINLFEYLMGMHPLKPNFAPVVTDHDGANFSIEYDHVVSRDDVALSVSTSTDLVSGSWTSVGITETTVDELPNRTRKRASISIDSAAAAFLRLEASE